MRIGDPLFSFVLRSGMELSWLCAWAGFGSEALLGRPFPYLQALAVFLLAAFATQARRLAGGARYRRFGLKTLRAISFAGAALGLACPFTSGRQAFVGRWPAEFLFAHPDFRHWLEMGVVLCFIMMFWAGGSAAAGGFANPLQRVRRFDLGITALLALYMAKFFVAARLGIVVRDPYGEMLLVPFFVLSLLAMGRVDHQGRASKKFLPGHGGIGVVLGFSSLVLLAGAAGAILFQPFFQQAAEAVAAGFTKAVRPLEPVLTAIVRFLFSPQRMRRDQMPQNAPADGGYSGLPAPGTGWSNAFQQAIGWSFIGLLLLIGLAGVAIATWLLAHLLWMRFKRPPPGADPASWREVLRQIHAHLYRFWSRVLELGYGYSNAARLFSALARWGRRSGIVRRPAATPLEYSRRLCAAFPHLRVQIETILEAYHLEVYRETPLASSRLEKARTAWRTLRSPRQWGARLMCALKKEH